MNQRRVGLFDFDGSACLHESPFVMFGNEVLENEVLPLLALSTLGMNSLVTLNSFGVYGNIIRSSVDIPSPL